MDGLLPNLAKQIKALQHSSFTVRLSGEYRNDAINVSIIGRSLIGSSFSPYNETNHQRRTVLTQLDQIAKTVDLDLRIVYCIL